MADGAAEAAVSAAGDDVAQGLLGFMAAAAIGDDDVATAARKFKSDGAARASCASGDEGEGSLSLPRGAGPRAARGHRGGFRRGGLMGGGGESSPDSSSAKRKSDCAAVLSY